MSATETPAAAEASSDTTSAPPKRGLWFWVARYLPAEIAGTAALVIAGLVITIWTDHPGAVAVAGLVGETIGFYAVLSVAVLLEQRRLGHSHRAALARTGMLLAAEFGAAEVLDTFLVRPAALVAGVWLLGDPLWGLLVGKIAADIIFYAVAAGAFTVTAHTGLRDRRPTGRVA